ncbi:YhcH/YjgK/YiaL family protein [Sodalis sp.]|uniref:YhcH/YjgK/YiaL family protein n=1 Tax=Sodalis sp. (in: enterobacteria) TaxID=1898979 RepID=UPI003872D7FD
MFLPDTESQCYSTLTGKSDTDQPEERDIAFLPSGQHEKQVVLQAWDFVVYFPREVHTPLRAVASRRHSQGGDKNRRGAGDVSVTLTSAASKKGSPRILAEVIRRLSER